MKRFLTLSILGGLLAVPSSFGAVITVYNTSGAFNGSAIVTGGTSYTETFSTNSSVFTTFSAGGSLGTQPGFSNQRRDERVVYGSSTDTVSLTSAATLVAVGADWDLSPGLGLGQLVTITLNFANNTTQTLTTILGGNYGNGVSQFYFGFTSDTAFTSFTLAGTNNGEVAESFNIDNLQLVSGAATPPPSGVPEPSTFGLMGLAMVGLGMIRRVRR